MLIGLTYDLRDAYLAMGYGEEETAEFDREGTIAALEETLRALGHQTDRIGHAKQLAARLVKGHPTSPRGCTASAARRRCLRCSTSTRSPTPSPTPW
jgi:hypothetical protein